MRRTPLTNIQLFRHHKESHLILLFVVLLTELLSNRFFTLFLGAPLHLLEETVLDSVIYFWCFYLAKIIFILIGCIFWVGQLNPKQLKLNLRNIPAGILSLYFFWALLQLGQIIFSFASAQEMAVLRNWSTMDSMILLAAFGAMLFGKAFFDEVVFKAYLIPQFYFKFSRISKLPERFRLGASVLLTQIIYLVTQIPLYLMYFNEVRFLSGMASLAILSLLTTLLFLRTQNTYTSVVVHTLWYFPLFAVEVSFPTQIILFFLVCTYLLVWPALQAGSRKQKKLAY